LFFHAAQAPLRVSQNDFGFQPHSFNAANKINNLVRYCFPKPRSGKHLGNNLHFGVWMASGATPLASSKRHLRKVCRRAFSVLVRD
jgi:hypothetical protein